MSALPPKAEIHAGPSARGVGEVVGSEPTTKCAASVARLTPFIVQPERYLWRPFRGDNAMNEICSDQNDDEVLQFEVPPNVSLNCQQETVATIQMPSRMGCAPLLIFVPVLSDRAG